MRLALFAHRYIIIIRPFAGFVLRHLLPLALTNDQPSLPMLIKPYTFG
jgi:hypothetical protein